MGAVASIIIPIAAHHISIATQAIASAEAQTVPVEVISLIDTEGVGAGAMRNKGVAQSSAPFVVFLDADDVIEPVFLARSLAAYQRGYYVYTDWIANGKLYHAPDCSPTSVWQTGAVHMVTCLIPTAFHYAAGEFDEGLTGFEDSEYFIRMHSLGMCGLRCPEPLLHYRSRLGQRSHAFSKSGQYDRINAELVRKYARYANVSCGCGTSGAPAQANVGNTPLTGYVLCACQYAPANKVGSATGKRYDRAGFGDRLWVHPDDAVRHPNWWAVVSKPYEISPAVDEIMALVNG